MWSRQSRRIDPIRRSANGFCHGLRAAVRNLLDAHAFHTLTEGVTVDGVSIAKEIGRGGVVGKGVHDLLSSPRRGGMLGEVEGQDPAPMVSEHDEDEKHPQLSGWDGEEVDRRPDPGHGCWETCARSGRDATGASGSGGRPYARPRYRASGVPHQGEIRCVGTDASVRERIGSELEVYDQRTRERFAGCTGTGRVDALDVHRRSVA